MRILSIILLLLGIFNTRAQIFDRPESIVYDVPGKRYFISNMGAGTILQIDSLGNKTLFAEGLPEPRGLIIANDTLLIAVTNDGVEGYLLSNGDNSFRYPIEEAGLPNDLTTDTAGNLYITDTYSSRVYQMDILTGIHSTLIQTISSPNGIFYDTVSHSLLVCTWEMNAQIFSYDLAASTLQIMVTTGIPDLDGLAMDNCRNLYFSSWTQNAVYAFDPDYERPPTRIAAGFPGAADISVSANVLAIPVMNSDTISLIGLAEGCQQELTLLQPEDNSLISGNEVYFSWEEAPDVSGYELEYSTDSSFYSQVVHLKTTGSDTVVSELTPNRIYYWRVRPLGGHSKNLFGSISSFTTEEVLLPLLSGQHHEISVYPNPTEGILHFDAPVEQVRLYDLSGKLVYQAILQGSTLDISELTDGVYLLLMNPVRADQLSRIVVKKARL